jgi:hypothetical protein
MNFALLKKYIQFVVNESLFRKTFTKITPEDQRSPDDIKRNAKPNTWRDNREDAFDDNIDEMIKQPEFKDVDSFVNYKLDNEEFEFSTQELQALVHNTEKKRLGYNVSSVSSGATSNLRSILVNDYGFKFVPRAPVKFSRGGMASSHGTNPYAGMGGGGSGAGSEMSKHVGGFHGMGGGPGAMGGGYNWDKDDKRNLPMGAAKKKLKESYQFKNADELIDNVLKHWKQISNTPKSRIFNDSGWPEIVGKYLQECGINEDDFFSAWEKRFGTHPGFISDE